MNKQYTKEEYEALVPKLIQKLEEDGVWGEFLPSKLSSYAYNQSVANEYFPLTKEQALEKGHGWHETPVTTTYQGPKYEFSDNVQEVSDDILGQVLTCEKTGKHYRLVKAELDFYKKMNLPIPRVCPAERHDRRVKLRKHDALHENVCAQCGAAIQSVYKKEDPEKVLCEKCYLNLVQ